ncbi:DUF4190 domain-containing protein [Glycomyces paridis]|uniref:DUF4190 domain-containing protein n=1 Tax=Glycomyces paridis TaxID=2126555 RepID=A0A4S8P2I0_9ACTN|nr:DUF4190 domain-containing protein [Glycomyces paridis]THV24287.1 DUF4190 domain-containing protein [Glycomyces paridis]
MTYPPNPDPSGQGGFQYDPYGSQPGSQPQQPGYSPQPQQPGYGQPSQPQPYGAAPQLPPPAPGYPPPYGAAPGPYGPQLPKGLSVASMVLGIIAVALFCVPFVNFVCGILAAVMGGVAIKKVNAGQAGGKGMAITGLVLGIIELAWASLWIILYLSGAATIGMAGSGM